jgi:hypothetical protein
VNAKLVAPWYQHLIEQAKNHFILGEKDIHQVQDELADLSIAAKGQEKENDDESPQIRYMLDFMLNRLLDGSKFLASMHRWKGKKKRFREHERTTCT